MRALKVLGIAENGAQVVCQSVPDEELQANTAVTAVETFTLAVDERLRAAVRGDLSRIGQLEIEMESQLRPREIQQRIRAGSTLEQVAAAAGCSPERVERYAYPVLLERSTVATKARHAHPVVDGVASARSVEHLVADTLAARGQQATIAWDAFRDERGWALLATWKAGRSENRATWSYHAGPAGGTLIARDESAAMLVDPAPRPLRTVGAQAGRPTSASRPVDASRTSAPSAPSPGAPLHDEGSAAVDALVEAPVLPPTPTGRAESDDEMDEQRRLVADTVTDTRSGTRPSPRSEPARPAADAVPAGEEVGHARGTGTDGPPAPYARGKRGQRPQMPSWEDVLLGTRTGR